MSLGLSHNVVWIDVHFGSESLDGYFGSHKRTKMVVTRHIYLPQNISWCFCVRVAVPGLYWEDLHPDWIWHGHFLEDKGREDKKGKGVKERKLRKHKRRWLVLDLVSLWNAVVPSQASLIGYVPGCQVNICITCCHKGHITSRHHSAMSRFLTILTMIMLTCSDTLSWHVTDHSLTAGPTLSN